MQEKTKFICLYGTVLFTVAFVLILMSAMAQWRTNRLTQQIAGTESKEDFNSASRSVTMVTEENQILRGRIDELEKKIKETQDEVTKVESEKTEEEKKTRYLETLLTAKTLYDAKKIKESATILKDISITSLSDDAKSFYQAFAPTALKKGAELFYLSGWELYKQANYDGAIADLSTANGMQDNAYYNDDVLYLIANSYQNKGDKENAKKYFQQLLDKYPKSSYIKDSKNRIQEMNKNKDQ